MRNVPDRVRHLRCRQVARVGAVCIALGLCASADAQIYTGTSDGAVVLSNFKSSDAPTLLIGNAAADPVALPAEADIRRISANRSSAELDRLIEAVAARVKVPVELLHAVIRVESNYDPAAVSPRGAMGLMQLLPATAKRFGAKDPFAASDNVTAGASYLKWLMELFDDDLELVLAAYNAGEQAVLRAGRKIPAYPETRAYVPRVLALLQASAPRPLPR